MKEIGDETIQTVLKVGETENLIPDADISALSQTTYSLAPYKNKFTAPAKPETLNPKL